MYLTGFHRRSPRTQSMLLGYRRLEFGKYCSVYKAVCSGEEHCRSNPLPVLHFHSPLYGVLLRFISGQRKFHWCALAGEQPCCRLFSYL